MLAGEVVPMGIFRFLNAPIGHHGAAHPRPHTRMLAIGHFTKTFAKGHRVTGAVYDVSEAHL